MKLLCPWWNLRPLFQRFPNEEEDKEVGSHDIAEMDASFRKIFPYREGMRDIDGANNSSMLSAEIIGK
jgi:hypothetical protein